MEDEHNLDSLFRVAVDAIDAGDLPSLESLLTKHPELVRHRLESPGAWLREKVGNALDGFFRQPYLLWFIAEDPIRNGKLPSNISLVARAIMDAAKRERTGTLQEQLDYGLQLVCWSTVAPASGVQLDLIDVFIGAGASTDGGSDNALVNGNFAAARHLVKRGAPLTLATAMCLEMWNDATRIAKTAAPEDKQFALVLCALRGNAEALKRLIAFGAEVNERSDRLFSHAPPLHHAAGSGSLAAVKVLVAAGAKIDVRDTVYNSTPLGWAEYAKHPAVAAYLRNKMGLSSQ